MELVPSRAGSPLVDVLRGPMEPGPRQRQAGAAAESVSYRLLFEKNPLPMWVIDFETLRFLEVNDAAILTYGYSRTEFRAMTMEDLRPPEDAPKLRETLRNLRPGDRLFGFWRHRKKDGTVFQVEVLSTEVQALGRRARLVLVQDATERLRTERHRATEFAVTRDLIEAKS